METLSLFAHLPRPTIFAHRGASSNAPENTLAAFQAAILQGADAIELDVKLTGDGHVVVFHDQNVYRTTGSSGRVGELTLDELRRLDAGSFFDIAFQGEMIPTLEEVFEAIGRQIYINIELTNYASVADSLPDKVAVLVRKHRMEKRVLFSSFNPLALWRIHRQIPQAPIGLLAMPGGSGALARSPLGYLLNYDALHPEYRDVNPALVERIHHRGCRLHTYTVNSPEDLRRLFSAGVDGVFTDDPALARQVLLKVDMQF